jgi:hypothetical protein
LEIFFFQTLDAATTHKTAQPEQAGRTGFAFSPLLRILYIFSLAALVKSLLLSVWVVGAMTTSCVAPKSPLPTLQQA